MRTVRGRLALLTAGFAMLAFAAIGPAASARPTVRPVQPAAGATKSFATPGFLYGVAAVSRTSAWAVGYSDGGPGATQKTLLLHWNGTRWTRVTRPAPVPGELFAVAAASASSVWAVGSVPTSNARGTVLVLHWNGTAWHRVPVPAVAGGLTAVTAAGSEVWAVNPYGNDFLHLTSGRWYVVPIAVTQLSQVNGIAMVAGKTLWAAGYVSTPDSECLKARIWGWINSFWRPVSLPLQNCGDLHAIASGPHGTALVIGDYFACVKCAVKNLGLQWTGTRWRQVPVIPAVMSGAGWEAVASAPDGAAWAFGGFDPPTILRWTGKSWQQLHGGKFPSLTGLDAVTAVSSSDAWAVGSDERPGGPETTLIMHWNGKTWS